MEIREVIAELKAMKSFWGKDFSIGNDGSMVKVWGNSGSNGSKVYATVGNYFWESGSRYRHVEIAEVTEWLASFE